MTVAPYLVVMYNFSSNRRNFLKGTAATLAMSAFGARGMDIINPPRPIRVGLVGAGWYGKSDLFRLMQVAPTDVVAVSEVDRNMLNGALELISQRQKKWQETARL